MEYYNGVVKIKDGLYIGDTETGEDFEFITNNKITRIINCAVTEQSNLWESSGILYLSFAWFDNHIQQIFDEDDTILHNITDFIDSSLHNGESCLIWSVRGASRCTCVVAGYLMSKYSWGVFKTLDYLNSRRPNLNLGPNFVHQLVLLQKRLIYTYGRVLTYSWDEDSQDLEDLVLRNTYLNARYGANLDCESLDSDERNTSLTWAEKGDREKERGLMKEGGVVVTRSCFKGQRSRMFTFICKNSTEGGMGEASRSGCGGGSRGNGDEGGVVGVGRNKARTPCRNAIRKTNYRISNQENIPIDSGKGSKGVLNEKKGQTRCNSARPPSPAVQVKKQPMDCSKRLQRPWK